MTDIIDLNEALGKALLEKFFEPIPVGRDPQTGAEYYAQSGIARLAQTMFDGHARQILDELWTKIDQTALVEQVAVKLSAAVVKAYTEEPTYYNSRAPEQKALHARVLEIVAQQLGQRVIDQMDVQLTSKPEIEATS